MCVWRESRLPTFASHLKLSAKRAAVEFAEQVLCYRDCGQQKEFGAFK